MANYLSTDPNAGASPKYLSTDPNAGQTGPAQADPDFMSQRSKQMKGATGGDSTAGFAGGNLNLGIATLAGFPVDVARNATNVGIAGIGSAMGAMGGKPPDLIPNSSPGGSEWFQGLMRKGGMVPPSAEPQSPGGRYAAAALQAAPAGMIPGAQGASAVRSLRGMMPAATSGVTAEAASDVLGPEYRGPGAMLPGIKGIAKPPGPSERATAERKNETFQKSKEMGIPVPPREMKADPRQQSIQDVVNRELGQPAGAEITPQSLQAYRNAHAADYEAVIKAPALAKGVVPNPKFQKEIQAIGDEVAAPGKALPETFKGMKGVISLLKEYGYAQSSKPKSYGGIPVAPVEGLQKQGKPIPPDVAMRAIKKLRADATTNFSSDKPESVELARVQRRVAGSLENLIEDNLAKQPELMQKFREARTAMAKSHDIESSLDPTTREVSAQRLSRLYTEGRPMTGEMESLAKVGGEFPGATKTPEGGSLFSKRMSPFGITHPGAVAAHGATRMMDPITMSKPYQEAFVNPQNKLTPEQLRMLRYFLGAQQANQIPQPPQQ
jgi:hypothetical protein